MKKVLVPVFGLMVIGHAALGAEVQATKKAAILTPVENLYGRVEVRQTSMRWEDKSGNVRNGVTSYRLVPRIGTKAFNDRLDMYVETPVINNARTSNYTQSASNYLAQFSALSTDNFSITPYAQGYLPHNGSDFTSDVAVNMDASTSLKLAVGTLSVHGGLEPQLSTGTEASKSEAPLVTNGQYTLNDTGAPVTKTVDSQEPNTTLEYIAGVSFVPAVAPKLTLAADAYFDRAFTPNYELRSDDNGERLEKTGYSISDSTLTDIVVAYKADSQTTIQSLTRLRHDGAYAASKSYGASRVPQVEQRISLIQKLF